ncbi:MAG: Nucleolar protein 16 [Thelocarpon impressellum]|nr:MAG: Nucleolar protein 16 [Thelocarpon impressellum]
MGRELQKKKNRSSVNKVRQKPKSKKTHVRGNAIIAQNWNQAETLTQNYRRLGLTSRLNAATGGTESSAANPAPTADPFSITTAAPRALIPTSARVERAADGSILRVIHPPSAAGNPLQDPLVDLDSASDTDVPTHHLPPPPASVDTATRGVIAQLEAQARSTVPKRPRQASAREAEWVGRLVDAHGEDYARMARDRRLNPMQQTEGDLRRRVRRWREGAGA